jgi:hypothetical protein
MSPLDEASIKGLGVLVNPVARINITANSKDWLSLHLILISQSLPVIDIQTQTPNRTHILSQAIRAHFIVFLHLEPQRIGLLVG